MGRGGGVRIISFPSFFFLFPFFLPFCFSVVACCRHVEIEKDGIGLFVCVLYTGFGRWNDIWLVGWDES
jgi:hypothetical protein